MTGIYLSILIHEIKFTLQTKIKDPALSAIFTEQNTLYLITFAVSNRSLWNLHQKISNDFVANI
jgi:hypothetical protein